METVSCNLCGSAETDEYAVIPDLLLARPAVTARLVRCRRCGLVYQNPRPTPAEIGEHYPPEYEPYTDYRAKSRRNLLLDRAVAYGIGKRRRFVTKYKSGGRLLDVGCAAGTFLVGMQDLGNWEVQGVELTPTVAELARQRYGLDVRTGTLEEAAFADGAFDAVTLWDVLEHVHDPAGTLREIRRILKPGGVLVARVPNLASWDAALFGNSWAGLDAPRHLYVFAPATLSRLLRENGLVVREESSAIGSYVTFALSVRFWMTAHQVSPARQRIASRLLFHPLARLASAPIFYVPSQIRRGPQLVVVAQRPV